MKGGGHLSAGSDNNGETDDEGIERRGGGTEKGKLEKKNMKRSYECIHLREMNASIQQHHMCE